MKVKTVIQTVTAFILIFLSLNNATAYDDEDSHPRITKSAIEYSDLNNYLIQNLGFKDGIETELSSNPESTIRVLLQKGSTDEDDPMCRASNHFHNPLLTWDQSQLTDVQFLDITCFNWKPFHSNVTWATGYLSPPPDGIKDSFNMNPYFAPYNWDKARNNYYDALTSSTKENRETYFLWMFTTLGHIAHLLEDVSVPAHVRNDFTSHLKFNGFNSLYPTEWYIQPFENYVKNNPGIINSALPAYPAFSDIKITDFWDTNQYSGNVPSISLTLGLAEFTNANYFSNSTIWNNNPSSEHTFPFPKVGNTDYQICVGLEPDGSGYRRYISRKAKGNCPPIPQADQVDHFAAVSLLEDENRIAGPDISTLELWLDDNVHNTYANELIPRAIGYSAALLDYFFRGEIDLVESGLRYKIENLSDEDMEGDLSAYQLYYDDINDDRYGITLTFYDEFNNPITDPATILTIPAQTLSTFEIELQNPPSSPLRYVLVFKGKLGNEDNAVIGKVIDERVYLIVMPVDPVTRETLGKQYYYRNSNIMEPIAENDLPFGLIDDGGYWDDTTSTWTDNPDPNSLKVPLSVGGPQYIAKYWDAANNRVRFVPNLSYEKNAYQSFHATYASSGQIIKDFYYVTFQGSPILMFGAYEENPGYMEYMNNSGTYGLYSLRPVPATSPTQRLFSEYFTMNFIGTFLEYDTAKFYYLDGSPVEVQTIPQDPDAPLAAVTSVSRSGSGFDIRIPKIFDYVKPNAHWPGGGSDYGSSGVDIYTADIGSPMNYYSSENKCITEDDNCGVICWLGQGSSNEAEFDIPYNFNSRVHVVMTAATPPNYEELYINGQLVETSINSDRLETHYQILAVYKDIAVVRETNLVSVEENPLSYMYKLIVADNGDFINPQIYDMVDNFTSNYYIYINGVRYDLAGQTSVQSRWLGYPYHADFGDNVTGLTKVHYLTGEYVEDITGYHLDRIFISDTFDGNYILVAFDEYSYNNGAGLVHDLKFEESDQGDNTYFLYYDIPPAEIQGASHEALPVGRQLLLFRSDGTLVESLQDPVGLNDLIGSIGILN